MRALLRHGTDLRITLARSDPISLAILDVLTKLLPPALFSNANLLCLTVCRAVNLSLEHGNSDGSCLFYQKCAALKFGALTRRRETTNPVIGAIAVEGSRCAGRVGRIAEHDASFFTLSKRNGLPHLSGSKGRVQNA